MKRKDSAKRLGWVPISKELPPVGELVMLAKFSHSDRDDSQIRCWKSIGWLTNGKNWSVKMSEVIGLYMKYDKPTHWKKL